MIKIHLGKAQASPQMVGISAWVGMCFSLTVPTTDVGSMPAFALPWLVVDSF